MRVLEFTWDADRAAAIRAALRSPDLRAAPPGGEDKAGRGDS